MLPAMPSTRSDPLELILHVVLGASEADHLLQHALFQAGVLSIDDLLALSKEDLRSIQWFDDEGEEAALSIGAINTILAIGSWFTTQDTTNDAAFLSLTPAVLTAHRCALASTATLPTPVAAPAPVASSTRTLSAANEFKKGIKRDITVFKTLKDQKQWNPWHHAFDATAIAQGLGNILDVSYLPTTLDEQALFDVLQAYGFAVFTTTLVLAETSTLVSRYSGPSAGANEGNAQLLYQDLVNLMSSGVAGGTLHTNLEKQVISLRLTHTWTKGIVSFLTHFTHLIEDLRELHDPTDTSSYDNIWCISAIDTALSSHAGMSSHVASLASSCASMATIFAAQSVALPAQTFDDYMIELKNHALILDNNAKTNHRANFTQCGGGGGGCGSCGGGRDSTRGGHDGGGHGGHSGSGGRGNSDGALPSDPTDPSVYLSDAQYGCLTPELCRAHYDHRQAARLANSTTVAAGPAPAPSVPDSVAIPSAPADAPSVASSVAPGSVLCSMMSTAAARAQHSSSDSITVNGVTYHRSANVTHLYHVHSAGTDNPAPVVPMASWVMMPLSWKLILWRLPMLLVSLMMSCPLCPLSKVLPGLRPSQMVPSLASSPPMPSNLDRIPSTTPGAEPPRGAKDSGSARSHSTHLETSSQKRP